MGERSDEMRGRGAGDDIVGRAAEETLRESTSEEAVRVRQTGETRDDTRRVRTEIERTRSDMSETIDEIQNRLSPGNIAAQARESIKEKTVGRVREFAGSASHSASGLAHRTRDAARGTVGQNPWPAILIGVGAAWMLFDRSRRANRHERATERLYHEDGTTGIYEVDRETGAETRGDVWTSTSSGLSQRDDSYYRGSSWRGESDHAWREDSGQPSRLAQSSRQAIGRARSGVSDFSSRAQHLMQRNPLAVGAVAAAVGVAVGLALPETERENRLMGDTKDGLIEKAQDAAQNAVDKVKEKAENATKLI
jgi:ElaB/YqjD/DUF883 family membrane-anchored ribosome-binding protein